MTNYRQLNFKVMTDTAHQCECIPELQNAIRHSIDHQFMVAQEDVVELPAARPIETEVVISGKRSFEAAKGYTGKKVAVLNFANNHSVGGAPFDAGAQEESLCRCSTLYPCLQSMGDAFYHKHTRQFDEHEIDYMGNDDLIYTPEVVVFKTDERTDPICPQMMNTEDWYKVDVITCAAPEMYRTDIRPTDYEAVITSRIKRILDVAARQGTEVLILGAWGCGAFRNPSDVVARVFRTLLQNYHFEIVEFALATNGNLSDNSFAQALGLTDSSTKDKIISLLRSTGRENIENVIRWLEGNAFFTAPASVNYHNNFEGGLAKHSLEVYEEAMRLNQTAKLPETSVILCSLLHDVCKSDQYVSVNGQPHRIQINIDKGHGKRSMYILKRGCSLPLNYDEEMAIWWHMGEHEQSKKNNHGEYEESKNIALCKLIREADHLAATR